MPLEQLDHVGVLVDDIEEARAFLGETLGLELVREAQPAELGVSALFYRCGAVMIEAFQISDPQSAIRPLESGQRARIDHLAVEVDDMGAVLASLARSGVCPATVGVPDASTAEPMPLAGNLNAWTEPETSDGVIYQLIEKGAG